MPSPERLAYASISSSGSLDGSSDEVAEFYSPDVVIQEFLNRIAPLGRVRRAADLRAAYRLPTNKEGRSLDLKPVQCGGLSRLR